MSLQEQINELRQRLKQQKEEMSLLFTMTLLLGFTALMAVGLAVHNWRELDHLKSELDRQNARVTSIIAETRGIGG